MKYHGMTGKVIAEKGAEKRQEMVRTPFFTFPSPQWNTVSLICVLALPLSNAVSHWPSSREGFVKTYVSPPLAIGTKSLLVLPIRMRFPIGLVRVMRHTTLRH